MKSKYFYSGVVVLGFILSYVVFWSVSSLYQGSGPEHLLFLSGGGMKAPVSEIAHGFEQETGIKVMTRYEGSASLRQYIARFQVGDVFLPGDKGNLDILSAKASCLCMDSSLTLLTVIWEESGRSVKLSFSF